MEGTDWANADIRAADRIMRTAREEWRRHHPCERKALAPVQAHFEELQSKLHDKIKAAGHANVEAKEALVAQAEALTDRDGEFYQRPEFPTGLHIAISGSATAGRDMTVAAAAAPSVAEPTSVASTSSTITRGAPTSGSRTVTTYAPMACSRGIR